MRCRVVFVLVTLLAAAPGQEAGQAQARAQEAVDAWLASDHREAALLDAAVAAVLAAGPGAIAEVGERARRARAGSDRHAGRGLDALITHVTVGYIKRAADSGITFPGQFEELRPLQPFVGELLLRLLFDTPDWFSQKERYLLVFPLRDVYPQPPGADAVASVRAAATDEELEPQDVRQNLPFLLAQWGDRSLIDARIAQVIRDAEADDAGDERRAALRYELADIHYTLREYERAAQIHVDLLRQAETKGVPLTPLHYYNAACCLARAGAGPAALAELERAVQLMRSGTIDSSQMLKRQLFERDPDLASIRGEEKFAELVRAAFGPAADADKASEARRKDR